MNVHELIYSINNKQIDDLLPITAIQSEEDVADYSKQDYFTLPIDEFKSTFPDIENDTICHLYYEKKSINGLIYYDLDNLLLFETRIYASNEGFQSLCLNDCTAKQSIESQLDFIKQSYSENDYIKMLNLTPASYQVEFICRCLPHIPDDVKYELFFDIYSHVDFGSQNLSDDIIKNIVSSKKSTQKAQTTRSLNKKYKDDEILHIYRGVGDKSNERGYSYSLNPDVARFFAFRYSTEANNVYMISADIKKSDVIEFITQRDEEEIVALPESLFNIEKHTYQGINYIINHSDVMYDVYTKQHTRFTEFMRTSDLDLSIGEHDEQHLLRVLALSILLAEHYKLKKSLRPTLYNAAMFHDIGRDNDLEDTAHGAASFKLLSTKNKAFASDELLKNLITYHCIEDSQAFSFKNDNEKLMYQILKDADALDRQRFGIRELNTKYLRLDYSFELLFAAFQLTNIKM